MNSRSRFEVMRRNRRRAVERALRDGLDAELYWDTHRLQFVLQREAQGLDTAGWLRQTRDEIRRARPPRRWWHFWKWFRRSGRA